MYRRSTLKSFSWAFEGIVYVLHTQRNMKIHFVAALLVIGGSLFFDMSNLELVALFLTVSFVIVAEMINTAIEAAIDTFGSAYDPMAKIAKDVAAAKVVGEVIGKSCIDEGITAAVFDRNGFLYHGRVRAVAEGAREAGLKI